MSKEEYYKRIMKILIGYNKAFPYKVEEEALSIWGNMLVKKNFDIEELKKNIEIALETEKTLSYASLTKDNTPKLDVVNDIFRSCGYSSKTALRKFGLPGMKVWDKYGYRFRYDNNTTSQYSYMLKEAQKYYDQMVEEKKHNKEHYAIEEIKAKKACGLPTTEEENKLLYDFRLKGIEHNGK